MQGGVTTAASEQELHANIKSHEDNIEGLVLAGGNIVPDKIPFLSSYSVDSIVEKVLSKEVDFVLMLSEEPFVKTKAKPLKKILLKIREKSTEIFSNIMGRLLNLSTDKNRERRYVSILLLLLCGVEDYRDVAARRSNDVDPHIRLLSIGYLYEKSGNIEGILDSLMDRSDMVRRGCLKIMRKSLVLGGARKRKRRKIGELDGWLNQTAIAKLKDNITILIKHDKNDKIKKDAASLLFLLYERGCLKKEDCYEFIQFASDEIFDKIFKEMCNVGGVINSLHNLYKANKAGIKRVSLPPLEMSEFTAFVSENVDHQCGSLFCYLEILLNISNKLDSKCLIILLELVKDNRSLICSLMRYVTENVIYNDELMDRFSKLTINYSNEFLEEFVKMAHSIVRSTEKVDDIDGDNAQIDKQDYTKHIGETENPIFKKYIIPILNEKTCDVIVRYFDISWFDSRSVVFCAYRFLWKYCNKSVDTVEINGNFDENLVELFNLILYFDSVVSKGLGLDETVTIFNKNLINYTKSYLTSRILSLDERISLCRLLNNGILGEVSYVLFMALKEEEVPDFLTKLSKRLKGSVFLDSYFSFIQMKGKVIPLISRNIDLGRRNVFGYLKKCVELGIEDVILYHIGGVKVEHCIALERMCKGEKVKQVLIEKIKGRKRRCLVPPLNKQKKVIEL